MIAKAAHLGWVSGRKMNPAVNCAVDLRAGSSGVRDIQSLGFAGTPDGR
jgi:hypothetical protein